MLLAGLALLAMIGLPVLAGNRPVSERTVCFNNLRRVGHAIHLWANDHGERTPWNTPTLEGGTRGVDNSFRNEAWFQMGFMSNQMVTPSILVCPSDRDVVGAPRKMAADFSNNNPNGGFSAIGFRDASLSYIVGLHTLFDAPNSILSGDRNVGWDFRNSTCSVGVVASGGWTIPNADTEWTNAIHGLSGNLLFSDGRVEQLSTTGLQRAASDPRQGTAGSSDHFLAPN